MLKNLLLNCKAYDLLNEYVFQICLDVRVRVLFVVVISGFWVLGVVEVGVDVLPATPLNMQPCGLEASTVQLVGQLYIYI